MTTRILLLSLLLVTLPVGIQAQLSGTYIIGATGDYSTITEAIVAMQTDTIIGDLSFTIQNGRYYESFELDAIDNGDFSISFTGENRDSTILVPETLLNNTAGMYIKGVNHLRFSNFTVLNDSILGNTSSNTFSDRASFYFTDLEDLVLDSLTMTHHQLSYPSYYLNTFGANIALNGIKEVTVTNCDLRGGFSSIDIRDYLNIRIANNYFIDNMFHIRAKNYTNVTNDGLFINGNTLLRGPFNSGSAIYIIGNTQSYPQSTTFAKNIEITNNHIDVGSSFPNQKGIYVQYAVNTLIKNNLVKNGYYGMFAAEVDSLIVHQNSIHAKEYRGIEMAGGVYAEFINNIITGAYIALFCDTHDNLRLVHNTFKADGFAGVMIQNINDVAIVNNILKGKAEHLLRLTRLGNLANFEYFDHNLFDSDSSRTEALKIRSSNLNGTAINTTFQTLADWQAFQSVVSQNSQSLDISFDTDSTYFLTNNTIARFGMYLEEVPIDIQSEPRDSTLGIDVGADQFFIHTSASFTADITETCIGEVSFSITSEEGAPTSRTWLFGDGSTSTELSPTHTYTEHETYDVSLVVCNQYECDTTTYEDMIVMTPCAGLPDLQELGITLYPNPTDHQVVLKGQISGELQLELVSIDGQHLLQTTGTLSSVNHVLNKQLVSIPKGLYVIIINQNNNSWSQRLILK